MVKLILWVLSCLLVSTMGLECFLTCGDFDNCASSRCDGNCGNDVTQSRMSFIKETCVSNDDLCLYREFILDRQGIQISTAIPGGCLLKYEHSEKDNFSILLSEGTNLFTCDSDLCNTPPLESCTADRVKETRNGNCFLNGNDDIEELFSPFSPIRFGDFQVNPDRRDFCVIEDSFQQFRSDSECFGSHIGDTTIESNCTSLNQLKSIDFISCKECANTPGCSPTEATPQPETSQPTTSPTINQFEETDPPTRNPTESPEAETDAPTENPSKNPTKSPEEEESNAPTGNPTESSEEFETNAPTKQPTASPEEEETESPITSEENPSQAPVSGPTSSPTASPDDESLLDNIALLSGVVFAASICVFCATVVLVLFFSRRSKERLKEEDNYIYYIGGEKVKVVDPALVSGQRNVEHDEEEGEEIEAPGVTFTSTLEDVIVQKETNNLSTHTLILPDDIDLEMD